MVPLRRPAGNPRAV